jgi:hypothetical protein
MITRYLLRPVPRAQDIQSQDFLCPVSIKQQPPKMIQQLSLVPTYPYLPIGLILGVLLPIFIALLFGHWKIPPSFPRGIPRVGGRKNTPGGLIACFRGWLSRRLILSEGYDKVKTILCTCGDSSNDANDNSLIDMVGPLFMPMATYAPKPSCQ